MQSLMFIGVDAAGESEIGICGEFAEDLDYAADSANEGFSILVGRKIEQQKVTATGLPPRFARLRN